jgi:protein O-GlcNAc transferase
MTALRRRWPWIVGLALVVGLGGGAGYWYFGRPEVPRPPEVDLTGADPEIAEAVTAAREAVLSEPDSGAAWGRLGMVLRAHEYGREANACFAVAERLDPDNPRWPYLRAVMLLLTDPEVGLEPLRRAVAKAGETTTEPRLRLAEVLLERRRLAEAEEHFRHLLDRHPGHPRALLGMGRLAYARGDLKESAEYLQRARQSPFVRKAASQLLAKVYYRLGDQEALRGLGDVATLPDDPSWPVPFIEEVVQLQVGKQADLERAGALLDLGVGAEAVAVLERTAARHPEDADVWVALGRARIRVGRFAEGERALRTAVRLDPDSVDGWFLLGAALNGQGHKEGLAECFRKVIALKPDHALAHYNLGQCLKEQGDRAGAREAFRAALRARPGYREAEEQLRALEAGEEDKGK